MGGPAAPHRGQPAHVRVGARTLGQGGLDALADEPFGLTGGMTGWADHIPRLVAENPDSVPGGGKPQLTDPVDRSARNSTTDEDPATFVDHEAGWGRVPYPARTTQGTGCDLVALSGAQTAARYPQPDDPPYEPEEVGQLVIDASRLVAGVQAYFDRLGLAGTDLTPL